MTRDWNKLIQTNFNKAAKRYEDNSEIQKLSAVKLAEICSQKPIKKGIWADLGSGTGLLAESLELLHPNQAVLRIDNSINMISQQPQQRLTNIWDLNHGLPELSEPPQLLASNFVLHWLLEPNLQLQQWLETLAKGGWIALSLPIQGSFPEWHQATTSAGVPLTALDLYSPQELLKGFTVQQIRYNNQIKLTQTASSLQTLFKPIAKSGAQTTQSPSLSIGQWRRLKKAWPKNKGDRFSLTWLIQMVLIQK